jgi:ribosome-associated toxin RatA of RatAB toxin-antitoxin module
MEIHFNRTEPVNASGETLFDVITDYMTYPSFNSALIKVPIVPVHRGGGASRRRLGTEPVT